MSVTSTMAAGLLAAAVLSDGPQPTQDVGPPVLTGSVEAGLYAGQQPEQDAVVVSPRVQIGVRARPEVELGFSLGVASLTAQHQRDGRVRAQGPGNFVFGAGWVRDGLDERHHGHLGFAFSLPTTLEPSAQVLDAHRFARATRGGQNAWEWSPATMGVIVPIGWSMHERRFDVGVDGAFGGLFSAAGDLNDPGFVGQVRGAAAFHIWNARLGGALAAVYNGREDLGALQTSVQPFVDIALCRAERVASCGLHLDASATVNVDAPYGYGPEGMRIWGTMLGLRWTLRDPPSDER